MKKNIDKILKNFIVFEGLDGAGTTTQAKFLNDFYKNNNKNCFLTCEPTSCEIGLLIRGTYLKQKTKIEPKSLLYLYCADRNEHINGENGIKEHLNKSEIVVSDRYFYSTFAYQGIYTDFNTIYNLNQQFESPEYVFYIKTNPEECLKRINRRGEEKELFEKLEILKKVEKNYAKIFALLPNKVKFYEVDGSQSIENISSYIQKILI